MAIHAQERRRATVSSGRSPGTAKRLLTPILIAVATLTLGTPTQAANLPIRVDLERAGFAAYAAVEPDAVAFNADFGTDDTATNFWNALTSKGLSSLRDSKNQATSVQFAITSGTVFDGTGAAVDADASAPNLKNDRWLLGIGGADDAATWEITGLTIGGKYDFVYYEFFDNNAAFGGMAASPIRVDTDGDGLLTDETPPQISISAWTNDIAYETIFLANVTADGTGKIIGDWNVLSTDDFDAWVGFQIVEASPASAVPEPAGICLAVLSLLGLAVVPRRRRRRRV